LVKNKLDFFGQVSKNEFSGRKAGGNMQVSTKGKYAVRAVLNIAAHSTGTPVPLASISKEEGISLLFLEQIFQKLRKGDIVRSVRGAHGGYVLARDPSEITIGEIIRQVEPPLYTSSCFSKHEAVDDCRIAGSCLGFVLWKQLAELVDGFLDSITVTDMISQTRPEVVYSLKIKSNRMLPEKARREASETLEVV
jgi:Rrf2 family iron-sulfur cluster assembly transcriptional regulator